MTLSPAEAREVLGLTPAEACVLLHVVDTVVAPRDELAAWAAEHPPSTVTVALTPALCLDAIDSLVGRGALIELTEDDLARDAARWDAEPLPVSWQVDRNRYAGDVDLTDVGHALHRELERMTQAPSPHRPAYGYVDRRPEAITVLGETAEACRESLEQIFRLSELGLEDWRPWTRDAVEVGPLREIGPWWSSRWTRTETGFAIDLRRRA